MNALLLALEGPHNLGFPVLTGIVLTPILGTLVIALIPRSRPEMHRLVSILTAMVVAAMSLWMLVEFRSGDPGFQFVVSQTWVSSLDIKFA
jgi:NADH-quinone oxidoreductase subunit M